MAKNREVQIENTVVGLAEKANMLVRKLQYPGRRGAPDRMFVGNAIGVVFIEFKRPGGVRTGIQKREGQALKERGANYHCVDNVAKACEILGLHYEE
jgi:hypothetical protein